MEILTKNEEKPQQLKRFKTLRKNIRGAFHSADNRRFPGANFVILVVILHKILYKPLIKLLTEREHKIKEGVENAEKAKFR